MKLNVNSFLIKKFVKDFFSRIIFRDGNEFKDFKDDFLFLLANYLSEDDFNIVVGVFDSGMKIKIKKSKEGVYYDST